MKRVLSLFSGCGGLDLGLEGGFTVPEQCINREMFPNWGRLQKDGVMSLAPTQFKTVFANDILPAAENAWKNFFLMDNAVEDRRFYLESIVDLVRQYRSGDFQFPDNIDVVTGGFPCQDFSVSGKRKGFKSHKTHTNTKIKDQPEEVSVESRGMLYYWMREVVDIVQPKVFIAENVKGLLSLEDVKETIESDFREIGGGGYHVLNAQLLHAADYGVPQSRQRVFFIGIRKADLKPDILRFIEKEGYLPKELSLYPYPTHSASDNQKLKPYVTVSDVLSGLTEPDREKNDLAQMKYSKAKFMGKHCQGQTEVKLDDISPTIRSEHHGNIEYRRLSLENGGRHVLELDKGLKERRLTVRECARIQTFPDEYEFVFSSNSVRGVSGVSASMAYKIIGNAVPPLLAYNIAQRLEVVWGSIFQDAGELKDDFIYEQCGAA